MKQTEILAMLKTIRQPAQVVIGDGDLTIKVSATDAMAARILEWTLLEFPNKTVGEVADALLDALWWQKLLYSMIEPDEPGNPGGKNGR